MPRVKKLDLGILLFKERLTARQWVSVGGILAALVMLNV